MSIEDRLYLLEEQQRENRAELWEELQEMKAALSQQLLAIGAALRRIEHREIPTSSGVPSNKDFANAHKRVVAAGTWIMKQHLGIQADLGYPLPGSENSDLAPDVEVDED